MGWFERQLDGRTPEEVEREHGRYLRASAVDRALAQFSGPFGVRRYVVRFGETAGVVRISEVEALVLSCGGGPPAPDARGERLAHLEKTLTALHRNMSTGPVWETGAIGVLRNAEGATDLLPLFDEDAAAAQLTDLPNPGPPGHPLETPEYQRVLADHEPRMDTVHGETARHGRSWNAWEVEDGDGDGTLVLESGGATRRYRCCTLGTFDPIKNWFEWQVESPLFEEDAFSWLAFHADWSAAMELGILTAARLSASWLFVQAFDADGSVVMVAVWD